jgi:hypothetical protein
MTFHVTHIAGGREQQAFTHEARDLFFLLSELTEGAISPLAEVIEQRPGWALVRMGSTGVVTISWDYEAALAEAAEFNRLNPQRDE